MPQRDEEHQPQSAELGAAVQLDSTETLDDPPGDPLDAGYVPPDRPYVLDDDEVSSAGMGRTENPEERLRREEPEDDAMTDPNRSGRLSDTGEDVGIDGGAASAEEAAVHTVSGNRAGNTAEDIDRSPDTDGAAAPASGRDDVGPQIGH
ncbi:DUF5709 domain-containing protein [Actinomycetes bacterium KLBMP 9759]